MRGFGSSGKIIYVVEVEMNGIVKVDDKTAVRVLTELSDKTGVSMDVLLSLYLIIGSDIFFMFDLFQGMFIHFPSDRSMHKVFNFSDSGKFVELVQKTYKVNGSYEGALLIEQGDMVIIKNVEYEVLIAPKEFLGHYYIYVVKGINENGKRRL